MKINELFEEATGKAETIKDLVDTIKDGRFTKDGSHIADQNLYFACSHKNLLSLKGSPTSVGYFSCDNNKLTSLEDGPKKVLNFYSCNSNKLKSLKGAPQKAGTFQCSLNTLTTLEGVPSIIDGDFICDDNDLTSLHDIHKQINAIFGKGWFHNNPIKSHVLGLLKIKRLNLVTLDNKEVEEIINKYLPDGDIIECQQELIEAGLEEYAQL